MTETHHKTKATMESIQLYGNYLKKKGTIHNLTTNVNPLTTKLFNWNFHSREVVSR